MHILIAPNAFKNSLAAPGVAEAIKEGLQISKLKCTSECFPVGDGGDGTGELLLHHCHGVSEKVEVHDPLGRKIFSTFGLIDGGKTAIIEMADASGLRLLDPNELDPLKASSYGTGELISRALEKGVEKIILCIGGSATVDGGVGILQALGCRFLNKDGNELSDLPGSLSELKEVDLSKLNKKTSNCKIIVLCDVENVLLGEKGAAAVFGPQKGATPEGVKKLENSLANLRNVVLESTGKDMAMLKHGGAAGGVAAGLAALLNAELVNGIDHFLSMTNFEDALKKTDLVITGEGSIDLQTLDGKGPFGVAKKAKEKQLPVIALAGKIPLQPSSSLDHYFDVMVCINNELMELSSAMTHSKINLVRTAATIGNLLALGNKPD
ncbi:MAG TPA: glycerate kinase [Chitinophagaceae bacterium]|nr:glycerate kinase [Chitinophagaceae bacterium]